MHKRINFEQFTELDPKWVRSQILSFIKEDKPNGDLTTDSIIFNNKLVIANMVAMEPFIFCGESYIPFSFPDGCKVTELARDGLEINAGDLIAKIIGPANKILTFERVILNLVQRLCGISTETRKYCLLNLPNGFKVMDTRKTTPGLRLFEKHACFSNSLKPGVVFRVSITLKPFGRLSKQYFRVSVLIPHRRWTRLRITLSKVRILFAGPIILAMRSPALISSPSLANSVTLQPSGKENGI